ncbi:hypothetical protein BC826DRAFT_1110008 [Russula brevipes]|nr:hypothetical protein BC826DRAFT_1110008 [Russula brevipes]
MLCQGVHSPLPALALTHPSITRYHWAITMAGTIEAWRDSLQSNIVNALGVFTSAALAPAQATAHPSITAYDWQQHPAVERTPSSTSTSSKLWTLEETRDGADIVHIRGIPDPNTPPPPPHAVAMTAVERCPVPRTSGARLSTNRILSAQGRLWALNPLRERLIASRIWWTQRQTRDVKMGSNLMHVSVIVIVRLMCEQVQTNKVRAAQDLTRRLQRPWLKTDEKAEGAA